MMKNTFALLGLILALSVLTASCAGDDDDKDDGPYVESPKGGDQDHLVWYESFEDASSVRDNGWTINSADSEDAFAPGFDGNAFWLGDGNSLLSTASGKLPTGEGTLEFWMLPKAVWDDGKKREILNVGGESNFGIVKESLKSYLSFIVHGNALSFSENRDIITYVGFSIRMPFIWTSGWTHVAVVWKNLGDRTTSGTRRIYLNGQLMNEITGQLPGFSIDQSFLIGPSDPELQPDCLIDEMRVYDVAKTDAEISSHVYGKTTNLGYDLNIVPMPRPAGLRPENGFTFTANTKIALSAEWKDRLDDLATTLQDTIERNTGFRPEIVSNTSLAEAKDVVAIGSPGNNRIVGALADARKISIGSGALDAEGYTLEVYENGIVVAGGTYNAVVHGLTSLIRVANQFYEGTIPPVTVVDRPDFSIRGTEMPGSNGELTEELKRRIRYLAELKLTHLLLPGDFYFDLDNDYTRENAVELFQFVRDHGMEPVPQIQLYGNARGVVAQCNALGINCAEGASYDTCPLVEDMYEQVYRPLFRNIADYLDPRWIHIGHDFIMNYNQNPACQSAGLSRSELYAYSVNTTVALVREVIPSSGIMIWADMILPAHHEAWLEETLSVSASPPVWSMIPKDITWCAYYQSNLLPWTWLFSLSSFEGLAGAGFQSYTAGPGGGTYPEQSYIWMRNAFDINAAGFIGRPGTSEGFENDVWNWLPAAAEHAWSFFTPMNPTDIHYSYDMLNDSYGSF
jgi:hypothetical protein